MKAHTIILIIHIICGFTALTTGIVPMVAQKGARLHRTWGKIYAWAMYGVSATTFALFLFNPEKPFRQFLLCIGILSFYFTFSGVRSIVLHRKHVKSFFADRLVAWFTLTVSCFMFIYGAYNLIFPAGNHNETFLGVLYLVFGTALGSAALADVRGFLSKKVPEKMQWFFSHFIRMLSAYVATFTAFCVVNVHFLPPLLVWILPGLIGGTVITLLVQKYKRKFNKDNTARPGITGT